MELPKVTIGLVLYNSEKYLQYSLRSLLNQDYPNIELLIRDQSPNGEAYNFIEKQLPDVFDQIQIEKGENLHHSGGHNALIRKMSGDYYICGSVDMFYPPNFVSEIVSVMEKGENKRFGSATCKLMRWDFEKVQPHDLEPSKTTDLDSCGLGITQSHHFYDVGQGESDRGQYDHKHEIFGPSGALGIYRKSALDTIGFKNEKGDVEYFDELIHYKNDVDLAYRLQWAGFPSLFIPEAKVYHDRQVAGKAKKSSLIIKIMRSRKGKSRWIRENSFFGHQMVLVKNYSNKFSRSTRFKTNMHQWLSLGYVSIFETRLLKQFRRMKQHEAEIDLKASAIERKVSPDTIEKLMN